MSQIHPDTLFFPPIENKGANAPSPMKCCVVCCEFVDGVETRKIIKELTETEAAPVEEEQTIVKKPKKFKVKAPISYQ